MSDPQSADLSAQVFNLTVSRNDAWRFKVTLEAPAGTPIPLAGKTVAAQLRPEPDSTAATDLTITMIDEDAGQFYVGQAAAKATGYYDIQVTDSGAPRTYLKGKLTADPDVTRP